MSDNVLKFPYKLKKTQLPLERVCDMAKVKLDKAVIAGVTDQGQVQLMTTFQDPAEVLYYLEMAKTGLMQGMVLMEEGEIDEEE